MHPEGGPPRRRHIAAHLFWGKGNDSRHKAAVARCRFDGNVLSYLEHGNELSIEVVRGFVEPSLCLFQGRYLLTLRNDLKPYVAWSMDGLHFSKPQVWRFDDGSELESYNTQQHWLVLPDACYLLYTRRGLDNDDIFRHRSPLMMSRVDSTTLQLKKSTEREVLPKLKDGFGNFGSAKYPKMKLGSRQGACVPSQEKEVCILHAFSGELTCDRWVGVRSAGSTPSTWLMFLRVLASATNAG